MMGFKDEQCYNIMGDNKDIVINMYLTSNKLKKQHNSVAYHKSREEFSAGFAVA